METNDQRDGITYQTWGIDDWETIQLDLGDLAPGANDDNTPDQRISMALNIAEDAFKNTWRTAYRVIVDGAIAAEVGIHGLDCVAFTDDPRFEFGCRCDLCNPDPADDYDEYDR
jgi:hypothetical protein